MTKKIEPIEPASTSLYAVAVVLNAVLERVNSLVKEPTLKDGDDMHYITADGFIALTPFTSGYSRDARLVEIGNCFKTREKAEAARDKIRALLLSLRG